MLHLLLTVAAGIAGYIAARNFVRNRLRFVDAIHSPWAPITAGILAFLFVWPLALLPVISAAPAVVFGVGIGLGTATGARHVRRGDVSRRQIAP
jgi:hypothetical protein